MKIAVPREIFPGERRLALTPAILPLPIRAGLEVLVQRGAGESARFPDRIENDFRPLCSSHVHQTPEEAELAAIRRSNETGLPYGGRGWVDHLCRQLKLDLTIRPRGRPPKAVQYDK
jgi:hypothetical protein